jgi:hypothetical protein
VTSSSWSAIGLRGSSWRPSQHLDDAQSALDAGDVGRVDGRGVDAVAQPAGRREHHRGLPECGQDVGDITEEAGRRAHDQDTAPGQPGAVRVQQVRHAVQRHRGLAGARAALHDDSAGQWHPDDPVLLGLDRGDDVAHPRAARRGQSGEQGRVGRGIRAGPGCAEVEHVVVQCDDAFLRPDTGQPQAPAPGDTVRRCNGGAVEGPGGRCPPVDQRGLAVGVGEPDAADVGGRAGRVVEPAEGQPGACGAEPGGPVGPAVDGHVAFPAGGVVLLGGAAGCCADVAGGGGEFGGEQAVQVPELAVLDGQLADGPCLFHGTSGMW